MSEIAYGKTDLGQKIYDFGFRTDIDLLGLARKYRMTVAEARDLRALIKKALTPNQRRKYASPRKVHRPRRKVRRRLS